MKTEILKINNKDYILNIHYENRKYSTASIRKSINIRIPLFLNREAQNRELLKLKSWVIKKLKENPDRLKPPKAKEYQDNDLLKINNEEYLLKIQFKNTKSSSANIKNNTIYLYISQNLPEQEQTKHLSTLISRCLASKKLPYLKEKIHSLNQKHFNQEINSIFFKNNSSNWGSCSSLKNINISTRLLFALESVLDYVCVHELAHLIEPNHSPKFWSLIKKAMPDYKEQINWLKENKSKCRF